ncbi:hypothetical protein OG21DRAFT_904404 [Imleria badia]|nr:hypothetical protein OG21DRAFT_904404 [Imleria badia]
MARRRDRDYTPIQVHVSHRAGPSLDIQSPPPLIPVIAPRSSQSESKSKSPTVIVLRRQPRPEPPVSQGTAPVAPEPIRERSRLHHDMHDASRPSQRGQTPGPERSPSVRPPGPFLPESLYEQRPPAAPEHLEGEDPPPGSITGSLYTQHRPEGVVPPPGAPARGPAYVLMPPGPAVVQLPLLFDTLMEKLREHRLAQLATVDQQRELMRYMNSVNDWLAKDVQDRQAGLQAITAQANQLRGGLGRLGVGAGSGISTPEPQPQPQMGQPTGVDGFIVPPVPPAPGGSVPPVVPYPAAFFPQGGLRPPIIPGMDQSPSACPPVIPEVPAGWGTPMPDPSQNVGPMGSVLPAGMPYGEYHPTHPSQYVHPIEEPDEPAIPSTPPPVLRSPLPVPGHGTTFVPPSPSHDSRSSTPAQESYRSRALPVAPGDVPNVIRVQPRLQGVPTSPIVSHPPTLPVPLSELAYVPSRANSSMNTYDTTIPSERGVCDRRPSVSMEEVPESPRRYPSHASAVENDRNGPQRMPLRGAAPMLPAGLNGEQRVRLAHEHPSDLDSTHPYRRRGQPRTPTPAVARNRHHISAHTPLQTGLRAVLVTS